VRKVLKLIEKKKRGLDKAGGAAGRPMGNASNPTWSAKRGSSKKTHRKMAWERVWEKKSLY